MHTLFVYIDESGNFHFNKNGTKYYVVTAVITHNPLELSNKLNELRLKIMCKEELDTLSEEYVAENISSGFHASEDKQVIRDKVFELIHNQQTKELQSMQL